MTSESGYDPGGARPAATDGLGAPQHRRVLYAEKSGPAGDLDAGC